MARTLRRPLSFLALSASLALGACAADDPHRRAKIGAGTGAVAGAVIGHQIDDGRGRYVGAAVGALTGAAVGHYMDRQQRALEERLERERADQDVRLTRIDDETLRLELDSEVTFAINSAEIRPEFRESLGKIATVVSEFDRTAVHVIGHTDSTGSESYNQQLSERRAESVGRFLGRDGVEQDRLRLSGRGELQPVADNAHKAGRSRNRRVEIYLKTMVEGREKAAFRPPV